MDQTSMQQRGIDYDLMACLEYNPQEGFTIEDVERVLAVWEGENDGDDWRWVLELNDGLFAFLQGGCDYTGWDCQSDAHSHITSTPGTAAAFAGSKGTPVYDSLWQQLASGKRATWRESTDAEMGIDDTTNWIE